MLSVIIPTRDRAPLLKQCLESLCEQQFPVDRFEVIVIDNGSTDDTAAVSREFSERLPAFRYYFEPVPGQHTGRNLGLLRADGEILVYGDDDIIAAPTWLAAIDEAFQDSDVVLVGGRNVPNYEALPPEWVESLWRSDGVGRWLGYYSVCDFGDEVRDISPIYVYGCNFSIRKSFLQEIGGFHPDVMPKENMIFMGDGDTGVSRELIKRGLTARYQPKAMVHHLVAKSRMTEEYLLHRMFGQGISDSYTRIRESGGISWSDGVVVLGRFMKHLYLYGADPFQRRLWESYWKGYRLHQREVRHNGRLLEWVLRKNYIQNGVI